MSALARWTDVPVFQYKIGLECQAGSVSYRTDEFALAPGSELYPNDQLDLYRVDWDELPMCPGSELASNHKNAYGTHMDRYAYDRTVECASRGSIQPTAARMRMGSHRIRSTHGTP